MMKQNHEPFLQSNVVELPGKVWSFHTDREILGGHTGRMKSVLTYSRDALAAPLRVLEICSADQSGHFDPQCVEIWNDDTRGEAGRRCHRGRRWF